VAIIGIIAAIAIPNLLNAIHRGRQKRTMADMRTVATAVGAYATDMNWYPRGITGNAFAAHISPHYIKKVPPNDGWGIGYNGYTDAAGDHYTIQSYGKRGVNDGCSAGVETSIFDCDICHSDGMFEQWPEGLQRE